MAETWKHGGLIWRGTWRHAATEYLGAVIAVRFVSEASWGANVDGERVGYGTTREAAMRLAKSRVPRPDRCRMCGQKIPSRSVSIDGKDSGRNK